MLSTTVLVAILVGVAIAQQQFQDVAQTSRFVSATTPRSQVPIIRHINRVNQDGSYTFGYEGGDGTFRVETRGLDGVIKGKYGYVDDNGQQKEVDYLAGSATGYEPSGQGITVPPRRPPPPPGQEFADYDDGSWRATSTPRSRRVQQQPSFVHHVQPAPQQQPRPRPQPEPQPQPIHQIEIQRPASIHQPIVQQQQHQQQFEQQFNSVSHVASLPAPSPFASASSFRSPAPVRQQAATSGGSPIDQFLSQHLAQGPASQQGFRQFN